MTALVTCCFIEGRFFGERLRAVYQSLPCNRIAEFSIVGESGAPDDVTEACEEHVGALLGSAVGAKLNHSWTVVERQPVYLA